jgi:hypothetical protein
MARKIHNRLGATKAQAGVYSPGLGLRTGAGDENRTRTISLGMSEHVGCYQVIRRSAVLSACP